MSPLHESGLDDRQLERYLLGLLPDEETEQLDELSIADDEIAWRLGAVENDLVDGYVSGTLAAETLERFESFYLSSPRRRQKVAVARSLVSALDWPERPATPHAGREAIRASAARWDKVWPSWGFAAAAALVTLALGTLLFQEVRLRGGRSEAERETAALDRRTHELERQLGEQRTANAEAVKELERLRASLAAQARDRGGAASPTLTATALVLLPQTRAVGPIPTLAVPEGADGVTFELRLESNESPRYQVALKDPATNQIVWRSGQVVARSRANTPTVSIVVPARVLKPQHYALELTGPSAAGRTEVVGSYAVQIVPR